MDSFDEPLVIFALGAALLLVAWLPQLLRELPLSLPIIAVLAGVGLQKTGWLQFSLPSLETSGASEHLTELVVIIALMGSGLRLDRPFGARRWDSTWRLLFVAMPLTILGLVGLGRSVLDMTWGASLLLGAALAPTDPVLASDVQTGPPGKGEEGEVRFALTSEAGLNDGLAFPFVLLALALSRGQSINWERWITWDFIGKLALGVMVGWIGGRAIGWLMFRLPRLRLSETGDGLVAVSVTLLVYAVALALNAYAFVSVFVAGVTIRASAPRDIFHTALAQFSEQIERVLLAIVLVPFGVALGAGLLAGLTYGEIAVGLALIFLVRPITVALGFIGSPAHWQSKAVMAFFGIRGIGTLYYLCHFLPQGSFTEHAALWRVSGFIILVSILLHGTLSTPVMRRMERLYKQWRD